MRGLATISLTVASGRRRGARESGREEKRGTRVLSVITAQCVRPAENYSWPREDKCSDSSPSAAMENGARPKHIRPREPRRRGEQREKSTGRGEREKGGKRRKQEQNESSVNVARWMQRAAARGGTGKEETDNGGLDG